ncbi:hypothetical protein GCM10011509_10830 [Ornithinimicrobium pekingense]|uniref:Helix-turn-helix domain-containing protein n=1 Tax=Ornithinimicrobium pekingense TaxID=384677 RepID=A0ABQ2F8Y4_9MICO|nr:hypothetical protein GCM10011509_10830 [Ornithinimicrobium pekingense]
MIEARRTADVRERDYMDVGATAEHERRKLEAVEHAAAALARAVQTAREARAMRDGAVRAAVKAGVKPSRVAEAGGISAGRVTHLTCTSRGDPGDDKVG